MMRSKTIATVSIALPVVAPTTALAAPSAHRGGRQAVTARPGSSSFVGRPFSPHPGPFFPHHQRFFPHSRPFHHPFFFRPFVPFGGVVVYGTSSFAEPTAWDVPPGVAEPAVYGPPPTYGASTAALAPIAPPPPPAPLTPSVIEYPTGRYELRGDGVRTPHTWVWIPNPPPAPPTGPPDAPMPPARRHSKVYRWTDGEGVVHLTDDPEGVPARYRSSTAK